MLDVLEKLELPVRSFAQHRCAEWLHDLLDRHRRARKLVLARTVVHIQSERLGYETFIKLTRRAQMHLTPSISYDADRNASQSSPIPTGWRSTYLVVTYKLGRTVNEGRPEISQEAGPRRKFQRC